MRPLSVARWTCSWMDDDMGGDAARPRAVSLTWVSRDVAALSAVAAIDNAAPYFIDADHMGAPADWPRGGMTIIHFRNAHLSYALTWYAMALLFLGAMVYVIRDRLRDRAR